MKEEENIVISKKETSPFLKMVFNKRPDIIELENMLFDRLKVLSCLTPLYKRLYNELDFNSRVYKSIEKSALKDWERLQNNRVHSSSNNYDVGMLEEALQRTANKYAKAIIKQYNTPQ